MLRFTLAVLSLLIPLPAWCQEQTMASLSPESATTPSLAAETMTLDQAIKLPMRDDPTLKRAALEIVVSDDRSAAAATRRLPSFELSVLESQTLTPLDFRFGRGVFGSYAGVGPIPSED